MLVAFDDTDSAGGGCTTHLAFHVLLALPELALRGLPRLVRLHPDAPGRTRGNGAVLLPLGLPEGPQVQVGELQGRDIIAFPEGRPVAPTPVLMDRVWSVLQRHKAPDADPGLVLTASAPGPGPYHAAVRGVLRQGALDEAAEGLVRGGAGRLGAIAATAWPGPPASYEWIAYRRPAHWGTPRAINPGPLAALDDGATFHTWDPESDRAACIPNTPCPVLLGLRGTDPERLTQEAMASAPLWAKEPIDGWMLWATNQASGEHVSHVGFITEASPGTTPRVACVVAEAPVDQRGGHVRLPVKDLAGSAFDVMAFEPTKSLRKPVRALLPGDTIIVTGSWDGQTLRLERLEVLDTITPEETLVPTCTCGVRMKSKGRAAGYACPSCGARRAAKDVQRKPVGRLVDPGGYEPPVSARRHLHRPAAWT